MKFSKKSIIGAILFMAGLAAFSDEWYVCAGSFKNQSNAKNRCQVLSEKGLESFTGEIKSKSSTLYRVFIDKAFESEKLAVSYRNQLSKNKEIAKIEPSNFWCVKYSGPKNRYVFVSNGSAPVKEVIKEVIKEVPVEVVKEVEVIKEVPVEKIVEVVKEVPVVKEVEVIKEVPVVKEVEVIKEVPVEKIVEVVKEVEVIKEVPVAAPAEEPKAEEPSILVTSEPEVTVEAPAESEPEAPAEEAASAEETPAEPAPAEEAPAEVPAEPQPVEEAPAAPVEDVNLQVSLKTIFIKDADTGVAVTDAVINIDEKQEITTDENGFAQLPEKMKKGDHTLVITHPNYVTTTQVITLSRKGEITTGNQISIPKKVEYERIKIVLDWGQYPQDLDANIVCEGNRIYYKNSGTAGIRLDRDDNDSYGPETITLENPDYSKNYSYYVTDYTNEGNEYSNALSKSNAQVTVFHNNDFYKSFSFDRPKGGLTWHVFDIVNGEIVEVNEISSKRLPSVETSENSVEAALNAK